MNNMEKRLNVLATDFLSACHNAGREEFLKEMRQIHRTCQQIFAGLVLAWLNDYATYPTDDRNQASVDFGRELLIMYQDNTGDEKFKEKFPMI